MQSQTLVLKNKGIPNRQGIMVPVGITTLWKRKKNTIEGMNFKG